MGQRDVPTQEQKANIKSKKDKFLGMVDYSISRKYLVREALGDEDRDEDELSDLEDERVEQEQEEEEEKGKEKGEG